MSPLSISAVLNRLTNRLSDLYPLQEAESIACYAAEHALNYSKFELVRRKSQPFLIEITEGWNQLCERLCAGEPVQYVTGKAYFFGLTLSVNPTVLIPRQETEEMVAALVCESTRESIRIFDWCTGSGCIALALKKSIPQSELWGADYSSDALSVAVQNARDNGLEVSFLHQNLLSPNFERLPSDCDWIVCNPPYVPRSEKKHMHQNVAWYEPDMALFVPDEDPLVFYKALAQAGIKMLKQGGQLFCEIHEQFGKETGEVFISAGYQKVILVNDIHNKNRFVRAQYG